MSSCCLERREVAIFSDDLVELEHPQLFAVHSKKRDNGEDGSGECTPCECCEHGEQKHGENGPAMADDRLPVCPPGRLHTAPSRANMGHVDDVGRDGSCRVRWDRWPPGMRWNAQNPFPIAKAPLKKSRNP